MDVNLQQGVFAVDDCSQGIALCCFDDAKMVKTFEVENSTREEGTARPRQVRLTDCGAVISGSDHRVIYIYDRKTGERLDELTIEPGKFFQTVA